LEVTDPYRLVIIDALRLVDSPRELQLLQVETLRHGLRGELDGSYIREVILAAGDEGDEHEKIEDCARHSATEIRP
jgi:hypothetical protein